MKMVIVVVMVALRACRLFYLPLGSCIKAKLPHFAAIVLLWTTYHEFILHHMNVMITLQFIVITWKHVVNVLSADPEGGECKEYFESACTTRYIEKVCSLFYFLRKHSNLHFVFSRALEILSETLLVRDFQKFT